MDATRQRILDTVQKARTTMEHARARWSKPMVTLGLFFSGAEQGHALGALRQIDGHLTTWAAKGIKLADGYRALGERAPAAVAEWVAFGNDVIIRSIGDIHDEAKNVRLDTIVVDTIKATAGDIKKGAEDAARFGARWLPWAAGAIVLVLGVALYRRVRGK